MNVLKIHVAQQATVMRSHERKLNISRNFLVFLRREEAAGAASVCATLDQEQSPRLETRDKSH